MRLARHALSLMLAGSLALSGGWLAPVPGIRAWAAASAPAGRPLAVRIGQANGLTHIDFPGQPPSSSRRDGQDLYLTFPHAAFSEDLARLKTAPTRLVSAVAVNEASGGLVLRLTLAPGVDAKLGQADGAAMISLFTSAADGAPPSGGAAQDQPPAARPDPAPIGGHVKMQAQVQGQSLVLTFPWRAPLGAAVFRRNDALWVVFDAKATIDAPAGDLKSPLISAIVPSPGADYAAVRIKAPSTTLASASAQGGAWTVTLGAAAQAPDSVKFGRDDQSGVAALAVQMAGSTGVFWITDPVVGDKMAVVTALAPAKGVLGARHLVDADVLASAQGMALTPSADDLTVSTDGDLVHVGRPRGLALSEPHAAEHLAVASLGLPQPSSMPALIDFDAWSKLGSASFLARYDALQIMAADEEGKPKGGVSVRLGLARFLLGSELAFEALGVLDMAGRADQTLAGDAQFRGLRGAARAMTGRYKDAQADFSSPTLVDDPASAVWRGYVAEKLGDHPGAHLQFNAGRRAMGAFSEKWRGRFAVLDAQAALGVNDLVAARSAADIAGGLKLDPLDDLGLKMVRARLLEAQGQTDEALQAYEQVAQSPYGALAAPAELHAVQIKLRTGKMTSTDAESSLDSLRFRWRGDATELETVRTLGRLYLTQGRYREALEALRSANGRLPDLPAAMDISADLSNVFKALFLSGQADGLQPIQALALFYDFKELTPVGADGDEMVRKLSRRLVDVDLLDQAAALLKYQVENRLDGVPKAQVSTDLAMIDLMNKRPEEALDAINNSRTTLLPNALNARRRLIEARAHVALGHYDDALELLVSDKSPEAEDVRADIAWKQQNWAIAGSKLEAELGDRWKTATPLTGEEQGQLVRAGSAYSLANDDKSLSRLRQRYAKLVEGSTAPNALKIALDGVEGSRLSVEDFTRAASDTVVFAGWLAAAKKRFQAEPSPYSGGAAQATRTQASTPPSAKSRAAATATNQTAAQTQGGGPGKSAGKAPVKG